MKNEFEVINNDQIKYLNIFLVRLSYRSPHIHNEIELGIILEGSIDLIKGKTHTTINENELYLINKLEIHELVAKTKNALVLSIQISPKIFSSYFPFVNSVFFPLSNINNNISPNKVSMMHSKIIKIAIMFFSSEKYYELLCVSEINILFHRLISELPHTTLSNDEIGSQSFRMKRIAKIMDYIEENFREKLLLSDIAKIENLSLSYLSHFFKDTLNMTFQDFLNTRRVEYAKKLFDTTNMNVLEVSLESGFSDVRYMSKFFMKYFRYTPIEYKKNKFRQESNFEYRRSEQEFYINKDSLIILNQKKNL